ncbi:N-acetylmuramate alpha-1-phosphate uridylyltransferase MurU [Methylophaga sp. OBS4]|uniref:N-acetylmuramate alpha-1-phosphate uridylyltransferase MurU n=1 Tax=Methylophaga sp. OBS4 TaxID=2991935 RepID=UPI0022562E29|nr:nucleotidyltransferase family protein [Methylophaga sp. OBS4]MCX4188266.1 nucleotidyltransferase family protein [Methylophaga sp. OBS4]
MKAMILAAGRGERLRPLTDHTPKPLIQAGNKRLIEYLIEGLVAAGFNDLVINHAHLGEQFPAYLGDGSRYQARIQYSAENQGGLETAGGIINALPLLGDDNFLVVNGDIWTDFNFKRLKGFKLAADKLCHLIMVSNPPHNPQGDFAIDHEGEIHADGEQKFTFSGIGIYSRNMFSGLSNKKRPLKPLFDQAIANKQISGEFYPGLWSDIGTTERLQELEKQLIKTS